MRAFFAIPIDEEWRTALEQLVAALKPQFPADAIKWTKPNQFHITLNFIAKLPVESVSTVTQRVREKIKEVKSFILQVSELSGFSHIPVHHVVLLIKSSPQLLALVSAIDETLRSSGIQRESRLYIPHLTLGRVRQIINFPCLSNTVLTLPKALAVKQIILYQSEQIIDASIHTPLQQFNLD